VLAIGVPGVRRQVAEDLASKKGRFLTLAHPTAVVTSSSRIGPGSVLCPFSVVSDGVTIGRCVILNYHASVGHDCQVGDFGVLSPYATIGGGARVSADVFLGLHASVGPNVTVGPRGKISSNSCVLASTPADSLVYGVPGRIVRHIAVE
jgi:sugar O-acyltransferase (sialic acid O-acetyltransferase NeuD family)